MPDQPEEFIEQQSRLGAPLAFIRPIGWLDKAKARSLRALWLLEARSTGRKWTAPQQCAFLLKRIDSIVEARIESEQALQAFGQACWVAGLRTSADFNLMSFEYEIAKSVARDAGLTEVLVAELFNDAEAAQETSRPLGGRFNTLSMVLLPSRLTGLMPEVFLPRCPPLLGAFLAQAPVSAGKGGSPTSSTASREALDHPWWCRRASHLTPMLEPAAAAERIISHSGKRWMYRTPVESGANLPAEKRGCGSIQEWALLHLVMGAQIRSWVELESLARRAVDATKAQFPDKTQDWCRANVGVNLLSGMVSPGIASHADTLSTTEIRTLIWAWDATVRAPEKTAQSLQTAAVERLRHVSMEVLKQLDVPLEVVINLTGSADGEARALAWLLTGIETQAERPMEVGPDVGSRRERQDKDPVDVERKRVTPQGPSPKPQ